MYWVSFILKYYNDSEPVLCPITSPFMNIESAIKEIEFKKNHYEVLSAWIDVFSKDNKNTVFHECYVDCFGDIKN